METYLFSIWCFEAFHSLSLRLDLLFSTRHCAKGVSPHVCSHVDLVRWPRPRFISRIVFLGLRVQTAFCCSAAIVEVFSADDLKPHVNINLSIRNL